MNGNYLDRIKKLNLEDLQKFFTNDKNILSLLNLSISEIDYICKYLKDNNISILLSKDILDIFNDQNNFEIFRIDKLIENNVIIINKDFLDFKIKNYDIFDFSDYKYEDLIIIINMLIENKVLDNEDLFADFILMNCYDDVIIKILDKYLYNTKFNYQKVLDIILKDNPSIISRYMNDEIVEYVKNDNYKIFEKIIIEFECYEKYQKYYNKLFIKIMNPNLFRSVMYSIENNFETSIIEDKRKKIDIEIIEFIDKLSNSNYEEFLDLISYNSLFMDLLINDKLDESFYSIFDSLLNKKIGSFFFYKTFKSVILYKLDNLLKKYIIDYFFEDFYKNIEINIKQLFILMKQTDFKISRINYEFYKSILKIKKISLKEMLNLFYEYKDKYSKEMFYDDLRAAKDYCYNELVDNSLKLNELKELYSDSYSEKYQVPIYKMDNRHFYTFVRCHNEKIDNEIKDIDNSISDGYSFSYISDQKYLLFKPYETNIVLLYTGIDPSLIVHICHVDSFSRYSLENCKEASSFTNELVTSEELIKRTKIYNEIVINNKKSSIKPSAYVCFERITDTDVFLAKKYNLPIVYFEKLIEKDHNQEIDINNEEYITKCLF